MDSLNIEVTKSDLGTLGLGRQMEESRCIFGLKNFVESIVRVAGYAWGNHTFINRMQIPKP